LVFGFDSGALGLCAHHFFKALRYRLLGVFLTEFNKAAGGTEAFCPNRFLRHNARPFNPDSAVKPTVR
jgi:hypothetical protein